jgi:hypothetical protein
MNRDQQNSFPLTPEQRRKVVEKIAEALHSSTNDRTLLRGARTLARLDEVSLQNLQADDGVKR